MTTPVSRLSRLAFACSGVPTIGLISNGIDYFLLYFYSQVIGLSAALTGLALAVALALDALSNLLIGYASDHCRSRLGRRHPFMYASIVPVTALYILVWYPPVTAHSQGFLFSYLLVVTILLRLSMTLFDAPVRTMAAELTSDYDERTRLAALPTAASWFVGSLVTIAMYTLWLKDRPGQSPGQSHLAGYQQAASVCGAVILASLLFTCLGLHPEIPRLHQKSAEKAGGLREMLRSFGHLLRHRSLRALLASSLCVGTGLGITASLWIYQYSMFYGMRSEQLSRLTIVEALASLAVSPVIARFVVKNDKKVMAMRFLAASVLVSLVLPPLLAVGWLPARGTAALWYLLTGYDFISQLIWIVTASIIYSLYADVTDDVVLLMGERLEGVIFAAQTFIDRISSALGALLAGLLLTLIQYPTAAQSDSPSTLVLTRLGLTYTAAWFVFVSVGIGFVSKYEINRSRHAIEVDLVQRSFS